MLEPPSGPLVEADFDVDIWMYRYSGELPFAESLCDLPAKTLESCRGRHMVHEDSICWRRDFLPTRFRYMNWDEFPFRIKKDTWERPTLPTLEMSYPTTGAIFTADERHLVTNLRSGFPQVIRISRFRSDSILSRDRFVLTSFANS